MDIERFKILSIPKIKAGEQTKTVRNALKQHTIEKQDYYEGATKMFEPIVDQQKKIQEKIDAEQSALITQLAENQKSLQSGFTNLIELDVIKQEIADMDKGFTPQELQFLMDNEFYAPSDVVKQVRNKKLDHDEYLNKLSELIQKKGQEQGGLSSNKKAQKKNSEKIKQLKMENDLLKSYRERIQIIPEGIKTLQVGQGIYTQKKRNAYKINPQTGVYGNIRIDVPKLYGQLKLIAHKDGKKVYDKQVDFDTLDLLTKRFNGKKKYSPLSKMVFDDLNRISDIPIHRTSNKYKKIGAGVVYYNNPADLLDRLELLGGSILAGNNGVKNEFSQIAHTLNHLGVLNNTQLNSLLKKYVI